MPCVPWIKSKRKDAKSGRSGAIKPDKLGLSRKANKCGDAGAGDFGALSTHETSPTQPAPGERHHKHVSKAGNANRAFKFVESVQLWQERRLILNI